MRAVSIDEGTVPGRLWLASMPGRFEPLPGFFTQAREARLSLVLCLCPRSEVATLSPGYHQAIEDDALPFRWLNLPMQNFGLPLDQAGFRAGIEQAAAALMRGDGVLLHCAAGIGRTGTAATCVLKHLGMPLDEAVRRVRAAGSNPETALQSGLVYSF